MLLPLSSSVTDLVILDSTRSTNDEVRARAAEAPEFTTIVTSDQTAGRGRLGRQWVAPAGQSLAASVLLRPRLPSGEALELSRWGWIPLLAGVAMTRAVRRILPEREVWLKWPNDVLVGGRKVSGILAELLPDGSGLVLGAGLNLSIPEDTLPTPMSTSLTIEGAIAGDASAGDALADAALSRWLGEFRTLYGTYLRHGGDEDGSGIRSEVIDVCGTLGQQVRVDLPSGETRLGTAVGIDETGRILLKAGTDAAVQAVAAGDVTHLRYE